MARKDELDNTILRPLSKGGVMPSKFENTKEGPQDRFVKALGNFFTQKPKVIKGATKEEIDAHMASRTPLNLSLPRPKVLPGATNIFETNERYPKPLDAAIGRLFPNYQPKVNFGDVLSRARQSGLVTPRDIKKSSEPAPIGLNVESIIGKQNPVTTPVAVPRDGISDPTALRADTLAQMQTLDPALQPTKYKGIFMRPPSKNVGKEIVAAIDAINQRQNNQINASLNPFGLPSAQVGAVASTPEQQRLNDLGALMTGSRIDQANRDYRRLSAEGNIPERAYDMARKAYDIKRGAAAPGTGKALALMKEENSTRQKDERLYKNAGLDRDALVKRYQDQLGIDKKKAETLAEEAATQRMLAINTIRNTLSPEQQLAVKESTGRFGAIGKAAANEMDTNMKAMLYSKILGIPIDEISAILNPPTED